MSEVGGKGEVHGFHAFTVAPATRDGKRSLGRDGGGGANRR